MSIRLFFLSLLFFLFFSTALQAEIITLKSDQEINVEVYGKNSAKHKILWVHSERGISGELQRTQLRLSKEEDIQIFLPDILDSYYITPSRSSLEEIPQQDFEDLISHYSKVIKKGLIIVANSRSASLVLNAAHHLQSLGHNSIAGIVLISPYLQKQTPEIGKRLEYQDITSFSNLPLYLIQAERSPRFVPFPQLLAELEKGGSPIYTHIYNNVSGGFHARDAEDLTESDLQAKSNFSHHIENAISLLKQTKAGPLKEIPRYTKNIRKRKALKLQSVISDTPILNLIDVQGKTHNLSDYKGKIVLVSFWASWCRPCIEEMPSLVKLKEKYHEKLEILAINVREDKATIKKFTKSMNINFPLLQDLDSTTTKDWKVFVYPSNYIVDKEGKLQFAATGAMDWQDTDIEAKIESLLHKTTER